MKVAIAGTGNVARYLIEEFQAYGHEIVVLTRSHKPGKRSLQQTETDYSISSLVEALKDCDALVSTIADFQNPPVATKVQLDMLEACKQSETCKTFIPSREAAGKCSAIEARLSPWRGRSRRARLNGAKMTVDLTVDLNFRGARTRGR